MEKHYGQIVEFVVRKKGINISELARLLGITRSSLYNQFNRRYLNSEVILRIGWAIDHDFSIEFPELFTKSDFSEKIEVDTKTNIKLNDSFSQKNELKYYHVGQIVERVVRKRGFSISELARLTNVSRKSVYNWFSQKDLSATIIEKIAVTLKYNFAKEFPGLLLAQVEDDKSVDIERNSEVDTSPLSLIFNRDDFSAQDIKDIIGLLSELYASIGGDYLKISGFSQFERTLFLA